MSDEADRRRTYRELEKRGQPTPGKYYYKRKPRDYSPRKKIKPKVKQLDLFKKAMGGVMRGRGGTFKGVF